MTFSRYSPVEFMSEDEVEAENAGDGKTDSDSTTPRATASAPPQTSLPKSKPKPSVALSPLQYLAPSSPPAASADSGSGMGHFSFPGLSFLSLFHSMERHTD